MSMGTVEAVTVELFRITGRLELLLEKIDPDNHSLTNETLGWIGDIKEDCEALIDHLEDYTNHDLG